MKILKIFSRTHKKEVKIQQPETKPPKRLRGPRNSCQRCGNVAPLILGLCGKCRDEKRRVGPRRIAHGLVLRESRTALSNPARGTILYEAIFGRNEWILGYSRDIEEFLPGHFKSFWLDRGKGILSLLSRLSRRPENFVIQSIWFSKNHHWDEDSIQQWLTEHPYFAGSGEPKLLETHSPGRFYQSKPMLQGWYRFKIPRKRGDKQT